MHVPAQLHDACSLKRKARFSPPGPQRLPAGAPHGPGQDAADGGVSLILLGAVPGGALLGAGAKGDAAWGATARKQRRLRDTRPRPQFCGLRCLPLVCVALMCDACAGTPGARCVSSLLLPVPSPASASPQVVLHNWHAEFRKWLPQQHDGAVGLSVAKAGTRAARSVAACFHALASSSWPCMPRKFWVSTGF